MSTELTYLTLTATLTALLWVPYLLNAVAVRVIGWRGAADDPKQPSR